MIVRLRLFVSSYAPLLVVAAIRFESTRLRIAFALMAVASVITLLMLIRTSRTRVAPRTATPVAVRDLGSEVGAYIASYLLPFVAVERPGTNDLIAYTVVFVVLAVVFINSDLIGVNPLLYLFGYRIYSVKGVRTDQYADDQEAVVISKHPLRPNQRTQFVDLTTGVSIVVESNVGRSA
jgi:hypothetical protein